jgi:hypothetical protein
MVLATAKTKVAKEKKSQKKVQKVDPKIALPTHRLVLILKNRRALLCH